MSAAWKVAIRDSMPSLGKGALTVLGVLGFGEFVGTFRYPQGPSMLPTINLDSDIVFMERVSMRFGRRDTAGLHHGDIVAFMKPSEPEKTVSKRVLGLPGDVVCVDLSLPSSDRQYVTIPKGHFWASGDNPRNSVDSRVYGPVPMGLLQGRILFRVWPDITWFPSQPPPETR